MSPAAAIRRLRAMAPIAVIAATVGCAGNVTLTIERLVDSRLSTCTY